MSEPAPTFARGTWLAARGVGLASLCAFVSLHVQVLGLFGAHGVLPLAPRLTALDDVGFFDLPTLFHLTGASDTALLALCIAGELASVALMLGVVPLLSALLCYVLYLSFVTVGAPFLPLQWDVLLLEACLAIAIVSPPLLARPDYDPPPLARAAVVLLVARLLFASGMVKLLSGDPTWRDLRAMSFHYETQPLPGPLSRFFHLLPDFEHRLETGLTLAIEIATPLFAFGPQLGRRIFAVSALTLMALITLTGNFGFFNLLTAALACACLDDALLARIWRAKPKPPPPEDVRAVRVRSGFACVSIALGVIYLAASLGLGSEALESALDPIARFEVASRYGLFAMMTTERPELVLEASDDGATWEPYTLPYKPGPLDRSPPQAAPHMPRLDWMLWFAALGGESRLVLALEDALLEGREDALDLFEHVPITRPRYVRCLRYQYHFAPRGSEAVWVRGEPEPFGPVRGRDRSL